MAYAIKEKNGIRFYTAKRNYAFDAATALTASTKDEASKLLKKAARFDPVRDWEVVAT